MIKPAAQTQTQNFNLKHVAVDLIPTPRGERAEISLEDLEALRASRPAVPASKNGLEVICGASCEIGAH
jgi:hypothetical protein